MSRTVCPYCGADLPRGASACRECGSDESTGWASMEDRHRAAFGEFTEEDYEEVIGDLRAEDGGAPRSRRDLVLAAIALLVVVIFLLAYVI